MYSRYLSPKSPLSERGLTFAPLQYYLVYQWVIVLGLLGKVVHTMKCIHVTSPLNPLSRRGDLLSLRSNIIWFINVYLFWCYQGEGCAYYEIILK